MIVDPVADALIAEIDSSLKNGFKDSSDDDLERFIVGMCGLVVLNPQLRESYLIRGMTINHIQARRHVQKLHDDNSRMQWIVVFLTVVATFSAVLQIIIRLCG